MTKSTLPVSRRSTAPATATTRSRKPALRVAVVDDHRLVLEGLSANLETNLAGVRVVISESSWHGLVTHPEFPVDVVVLDLNLSDGIPVGTKIRALTSAGIRTVVMSVHADGASIHGALAAGALAFVPKTESSAELFAAVKSVAGGVSYLSTGTATRLENRVAAPSAGLAANLGKQEQRALSLYASGRSVKEVADEMGTTVETVKSYIKRARRKYRQVGVDVGTKLLLRRQGIDEGWFNQG